MQEPYKKKWVFNTPTFEYHDSFRSDYTMPCSSMAVATFMKPAMLAPFT